MKQSLRLIIDSNSCEEKDKLKNYENLNGK